MDLTVWLQNLGLERYAAVFRENEIDESVLGSLTAEDLKDLGVDIVGHRRKLLDAIAALHAERNVASGASEAVAKASASRDSAERRQVTVLFSDLVGSTELSSRIDVEDLREVISAYQKCVADIVRRSDGFVAQYMGDGVLVYFGYPQAHEDDAERAVRAGLEITAMVSALKIRGALEARVGIATGIVVVGEIVGDEQDRGIVGETPNLAARLQSVAEASTVVIADNTRKLIGNLFDLKDLGAKDLKGIAGPVHAWAALRPAPVESRFEALHASSMTALVGRKEETELLRRRWERSKCSEGQVVLLSGEAGIGKSRLTATLLESLASEPFTRIRYFCSPQHSDSAFYPIIGQLERAAGLTYSDSLHEKLDKLDAMLALISASTQEGALFAELLSLPNDGRYPTLNLTPQQRRQKTLDALMVQLEQLSRSNPLLMIFEDAHWADPTTLEALGRAIDRLRNIRVLLLVTFRPEFQAPWIERPYVTTLTINRLGEREAGEMIDVIVGNKVLPASIRQDIIERTDGIPLFVEEMTKAVLEAGSESAAERAIAAIPSAALPVPASLHASLMARLDRLGPAKEVAQIGATLGREFSHGLLAAVMRKAEAELQPFLDRLIEAGLLFRQGVPPDASYLFKHVLLQDAAYGTLLRGPRRALHARIAGTIESQFLEISENQPELLARHYAEAGLGEKAANFWGKAGQRSLARSALVEAVMQLSRALELIASLPATPMLRREQIKLQVALITPLIHVKGYAAPDTKAATERAHLLIEQAKALGEPPEDPLLLFSVLYSFWVANYVAFKGDLVCDLAERFLAMAQKQETTAATMVGHRLMGQSLLHTGNIAEALAHYDRALTLYNHAEHRSLAIRFGQDQRMAALCFRSLAWWLLGYPAASRADATEALNDARELGQAASLMVALGVTGITHILCRNFVAAKVQSDELVPLADQKGAALWRANGIMNLGCVLALTGDAAEAVRTLTSGINAFRLTGGSLFVHMFLSFLASANAALGQFDDAWRCIGEAMAEIKTTKETWFEAETHRMAGEIALTWQQPDKAKAQAYFNRALTIARERQAKAWELRAAMSMARLWRDQGKRFEACDLLAPVYDWFTEGFDTLDLKEAKALLDELA